MTPYYKQSDAKLLTWATTLSAIVSAEGESLGVPANRVAALGDAVADYNDAFGESANASTRTRAAVARKNDSRDALIAASAAVVAIVDTDANISNDQRIRLGLPPRRSRQRWQTPEEAPIVEVTGRDRATVSIRLKRETGGRGKPNEVSGATLFYYVGAEPVKELSAWRFQNVTRTTADVHFPSDLSAGTPVWITARWFNRTGAGPLARPVGTVLAGGGLMRAAA
jgi:hypothetical protein